MEINIEDEEINIENIMRQIKNDIRTNKDIYSDIEADMRKNIEYINSNWNIHVKYDISSHRPVIGNLLVFGRQTVHNEVRRYVDLLVERQKEFNSNIVQILSKIDELHKYIAAGIDKNVNKIDETRILANKYTDKKVNNVLNEIHIKIDKTMIEKMSSSQNVADIDYLSFENKFRGASEDIKKNQSIFLEYFKNCCAVLDIGCGRGEFLSLLKENGIPAKGIDINDEMVSHCKTNGLDVQKIDALSYLESIECNSLDGIFSGQVVEHLQPNELITLIRLCYDKMKFGKYFVAETINPLCLSIFTSTLYLDLSHVRPVHPETFKFLLESAGFKDIQFKFFTRIPEETRLQTLEVNENDEGLNKICSIMNKNVEKLNNLLYGDLDYATIAMK